MTPFFITGMPRCRTAWLANLFTTEHTLCLHEPRAPARELVARYPGMRMGVSCSSLVFRYRKLADEFPESRWLLVHRDPGQVLESLTRFVGRFMTRRQAREVVARHIEAQMQISSTAVRHVWFEDLSRLDMIRGAWGWLLPELPFNELRVNALQRLNVQCFSPDRLSEGEVGVIVSEFDTLLRRELCGQLS